MNEISSRFEIFILSSIRQGNNLADFIISKQQYRGQLRLSLFLCIFYEKKVSINAKKLQILRKNTR